MGETIKGGGVTGGTGRSCWEKRKCSKAQSKVADVVPFLLLLLERDQKRRTRGKPKKLLFLGRGASKGPWFLKIVNSGKGGWKKRNGDGPSPLRQGKKKGGGP